MKKGFIFLCAAASLLFTSIIQAETAYNKNLGQYLSVNGGASYASNLFQSGITKSGFLGFGGNIILGTMINENLAAEVAGNYFSFGTTGGVTILSLNGRVTVPAGNRVSLFGKLGIGYGELTTQFGNNGKIITDLCVPTFGLGIGYHATDLWMVTLESTGAYFKSSANVSGVVGGLTIGGTRYFNE